MVDVGGVGDVFEDAALEDHAGLEALRRQPGEVDGGVYADRGEGYAEVVAGGDLITGEGSELMGRSVAVLEGYTEGSSRLGGYP